ncbi:LCP family protein [Candidatus Saccharibacteria bacterium]|nr:LCP family protein [Candidatus Saccharibacteria bacterium]
MNKTTKRVYRVVALLLAVAQLVVATICVVSLVRMDFLETWMIVLVAGVFAILFVICIMPLVVWKRKKLIPLRIICMIISITCIAGGIFALRYTDSINAFLDKVSLTGNGIDLAYDELDITRDPFILYISGSDSHTSVDDPDARSDVNILAVVNPAESKILLVSIPRDTYVQLHGTTGLKDKLTHAGLNNNIELSKATIEDFLGIDINHVVKVGFDTIVKVVDELDGVEIYSDTALNLSAGETAPKGKMCNFVVGKQVVDGDCALRFSRERKSYARGDKHRGENQQEVLTGIINKMMGSRSYLMKLPEILEIIGDSFETSFSRDEITDFMRMQLNQPREWQVESIGLDGVGDMLPTYTYGEDTPLWVMIPDEESFEKIKAEINQYLTV